MIEKQSEAYSNRPRRAKLSPRQAYLKHRQRRQGKVFNIIVVGMAVSALVSVFILSGLLQFPFYNSFNKIERFAEKGNIVCVGKHVHPVEVTGVPIKVLNGTSRAGLADTVGTALAAVGADFKEKANYDNQFFGSVRIVTNANQITKAYSLARFFENATVYLNPDATEVIQIIVGDAFTEMKTADELKTLAGNLDEELENPEGCLPVKK